MLNHKISAVMLALSLLLSSPLEASAKDPAPAPLNTLVAKVRIPYQSFTLANGLRVLVHTDRKAPVVAVSVWYDVGSKQEPAGKTGFAHLFEHLMFNGSENASGDFFEPMQRLGATGMNGSTSYDRTNYYETVPKGALARTLFLESDRMGHLLGAVTQEKLDSQRGVVQNEKRQGDNKPFGLVRYAPTKVLFPAGHPYGHETIGSMTDLDNASLDDVKGWFREHYGPNNAVLVLAGDIDVAAAKTLVEKYFGDIPRGPAAQPVTVPIPTLPARVDDVMKDRVAATRLYRTWVVPGLNDPDTVPLSVGAEVLGGLSSSRLANTLVRDEKLAVSVQAGVASFAQMSRFEVVVDVKPGVDSAMVSKRLDALIEQFVREGPTAAEVSRVATGMVAGNIAGLETVGGKAARLATGLLYSDDPEHYRKELAAYAGATPVDVRAALQKWLSRPVYALTVEPGARPAEIQPAAPSKKAAPTVAATAAPAPAVAATRVSPPIEPVAGLDFPKVTHLRLSNGVELIYAQRDAVPVTRVSLSFDAGYAGDPKDKLGTAMLMANLLTEGTTSLNSVQIAERQETLAANIEVGSSLDRTTVSLAALSDNLAPSLDLLADVAFNPVFEPGEIERLRQSQLTQIASEKTSPGTMISRYLMPQLYGSSSPYGIPGTGSGTADSVKRITRDDLIAFHDAWIRPENARLFVVSDQPLKDLAPLLDARFGHWQAKGPAGVKTFPDRVPGQRLRIVLIDRKDSPQSLIVGAQLLPLRGSDDLVDLQSANDVVGGAFLSRINMDLRESKGWSYGVHAGLGVNAEAVTYQISAPVQADKTGAAIKALREDFGAFLKDKGVTADELDRTREGNIRELPGAFETASAVLLAIQRNDLYHRADDFYVQLPARHNAQSADMLDRAARTAIDPDHMLWVVVGDAAIVKPQLDALELSVTMAAAE
jgi:predicted Zn-dependent peptidase